MARRLAGREKRVNEGNRRKRKSGPRTLRKHTKFNVHDPVNFP